MNQIASKMLTRMQGHTALHVIISESTNDNIDDRQWKRQQTKLCSSSKLNKKGKEKRSRKQQERKARQKNEARMKDGGKGGGTVLTPACLFYLGAQHGYRCYTAPSHRDMTASLCSHTIPHIHALPAPLAVASPCYSSSSSSISLPGSQSCTLSDFTLTHTYTHTLNLTLSSGSPLSFTSDSPSLSHWPSTLLFLTYLEPCLLSPSLSLWSVSLSVTLPSAAHSQYQFLTIYTYVWLGVLCLVILFCVFSFAIAPQSSQSPQLVVEIWLWAHVNPDVQPQINIFDSTDISLTTKCYDAVKVDVTPRCRRIAVNLRSFADIFKWN